MEASIKEALRLFDMLNEENQTKYLERMRNLVEKKKAPTSAATEHEGSYRGLFIHTRQA